MEISLTRVGPPLDCWAVSLVRTVQYSPGPVVQYLELHDQTESSI